MPHLFQVRLDGALANLVWLKTPLLTAGQWTKRSVKVPADPKPS